METKAPARPNPCLTAWMFVSRASCALQSGVVPGCGASMLSGGMNLPWQFLGKVRECAQEIDPSRPQSINITN